MTDCRLLRLAARCPACGSSPAVRVSELEARSKKKWAAHWVAMTVVCLECAVNRNRTVVYEVRASAFQGAS